MSTRPAQLAFRRHNIPDLDREVAMQRERDCLEAQQSPRHLRTDVPGTSSLPPHLQHRSSESPRGKMGAVPMRSPGRSMRTAVSSRTIQSGAMRAMPINIVSPPPHQRSRPGSPRQESPAKSRYPTLDSPTNGRRATVPARQPSFPPSGVDAQRMPGAYTPAYTPLSPERVRGHSNSLSGRTSGEGVSQRAGTPQKSGRKHSNSTATRASVDRSPDAIHTTKVNRSGSVVTEVKFSKAPSRPPSRTSGKNSEGDMTNRAESSMKRVAEDRIKDALSKEASMRAALEKEVARRVRAESHVEDLKEAAAKREKELVELKGAVDTLLAELVRLNDRVNQKHQG